jgi:tRNA pseudouridine55 synthase
MTDGVVFIDKAAGVTSRSIDNQIQKRFANRKVGHLGTLDPFATGLLILAVGKATKFLPYIDDSKKSYLASLTLGIHSSTGDPEGILTKSEGPVPELTDQKIANVLKTFLGKSQQIPPMTSAIKQDGTALYTLAHEGETVERTPRTIEVYDISLLHHEGDHFDFVCTVSKGTYIRVLGEDIAKALGSVGYLTALRRLSIGPWQLRHAHKLEALDEHCLIDPTVMVTGMKHQELDDEQAKKAKNGVLLELDPSLGPKVLVVQHTVAIAIYRQESGNHYVSERGLF